MPFKVVQLGRSQRIGYQPVEYEVRLERAILGHLLVSKEGVSWRVDGKDYFLHWEELGGLAVDAGQEVPFGTGGYPVGYRERE